MIIFIFLMVIPGFVFQNALAQDVLFINKEAVSEDEFIFFLKPERALTYNYFYTNYGAEQSPEFWNTSYAGETPGQYIQNRAIEKLVEVKTHLILARELGLLEDIRFSSIENSFELENKRRREAREKGEVIYGPKEFSMHTFFSYWYSNLVISLRKEWGNRYQPNNDSLRNYYQRNRNDYRSPDELFLTEAGIPYIDDQDKNRALKHADEIIATTLFDLNICKRSDIECEDFTILENGMMESEDYLASRYNLARQLKAGEYGGPIDDSRNQRIILLVCKDRKEGHIQSYEKVRQSVIRRYKDKQFLLYMEERARVAEIKIVSDDISAIILKNLK